MRTIEQIDHQITLLKEKLKNVKGTETEVYTRIVGYHRAVDNWNKGKREEYKNRQTFEFDAKEIKEKSILALPEKEVRNNNTDNDWKEQCFNLEKIAFYKLFTSQFCRNCTPVKEFMNKLSIIGEEVDVSTDLGINASKKYNILSTPTVVLFDNNDSIVSKAYSVEELRKNFCKTIKLG